MSLLMCPESHGCINKFCREEKRTSRTTCRHRHHTENHGETFHTPELRADDLLSSLTTPTSDVTASWSTPAHPSSQVRSSTTGGQQRRD